MKKALKHAIRLLREEEENADRKTENSSEIPNNCEVKNYCDDCLYTDTCDSKEFFYACTSKATISKMEQVDKDINVRSKDEPTTQMKTQKSNLSFEKDEPQTEVDWKQRLCDMYGTDRKSLDEAWEKYEADKVKDDPQTDCDHKCIQTEIGCEKTDCAWK